MSDEELEFDPGTVICEKCGGIVKFRGSGKYECSECGNIVLDDFGKVRDFLEKRGPSNIMEIAYATGLEKSVVSKLLMDGRIQVLQHSTNAKNCSRCGIPITRGKYCSECAELLSKIKKKALTTKKDSSKMRFLNSENTTDKKKKKK